MSEKLYQVFISSTYADLKEERQTVIKTVIELNRIPAGMELFPALDEAQLTFIKRVIDDCDYYLLIVGGRYGSISEAGISYTEQEYDHAVGRGLKVIALIHENPDDIPFGKSEQNPEFREKLKQFRNKVSTGRLVKTWKSIHDLPGLVALSLSSTIRQFPAVGWIRADRAANEEVLGEINELRKRNGELEAAFARMQALPAIEGLARLDEKIRLQGFYYDAFTRGRKPWSVDATWREIFGYISPYLIETPAADTVKSVLTTALFKRYGASLGDGAQMDDQDFKTVSIQLKALGLVEFVYSKTMSGGMALFWSQTPSGERLMMKLRTVPTAGAAEVPKLKPGVQPLNRG
jgi:uncharacterized protein DUF4062